MDIMSFVIIIFIAVISICAGPVYVTYLDNKHHWENLYKRYNVRIRESDDGWQYHYILDDIYMENGYKTKSKCRREAKKSFKKTYHKWEYQQDLTRESL